MTEALAQAAASLADQAGAEPDTLKAAGVENPDHAIREAAAAPQRTERDPEHGRPYDGVHTEKVSGFLQRHVPEAARELGVEGVAAATSSMQAMPRELVHLLDGEGFFGKPLSWHLLAQVERNRAAAPAATEAASHVPLTIEHVQAHAAEHGLPGDLETAGNVMMLVNALPPRIRTGLSVEMARDPDLWALASHLGKRLWAFQMRRPVAERR